MKLLSLIFLSFVFQLEAAALYPENLPKEDFEFLVVSTHNLDGQLTAFNVESNRPIGGMENIKKYVGILRAKWGKKIVLTHTGTLFHKDNDQAAKDMILSHVRDLNYDAILVSEKEIAEDMQLLKDSKLPIITTNVLDVKTGETHFPKEIRLEKNGRKFLFLAVYSFQRLKEKYLNPFLPGIYFKDDVLSAIEQKNSASQYSPHFTIVLGSFNHLCSSQPSKLIYKWGQGPHCEKKSDIYYFMRKLPKDAVDLIINANGSAATGYLKNTIISQGSGRGAQLSLTGLSYFDQENVLDIKKSYGFFPVETCLKKYTEGKHCTGQRTGFFNKIMSLFSSSDNDKNDLKFLGKSL